MTPRNRATGADPSLGRDGASRRYRTFTARTFPLRATAGTIGTRRLVDGPRPAAVRHLQRYPTFRFSAAANHRTGPNGSVAPAVAERAPSVTRRRVEPRSASPLQEKPRLFARVSGTFLGPCRPSRLGTALWTASAEAKKGLPTYARGLESSSFGVRHLPGVEVRGRSG